MLGTAGKVRSNSLVRFHYGHTINDRSARTYPHQLCTDDGSNLQDLPGVMVIGMDRER